MSDVVYFRHPEASDSEIPLAAQAGDLVFFAGNLPWCPKDEVPKSCRPVPGYPNHWSQINRDLTYIYSVLDNVLQDAGSDLRSTMKLNCYQTSATDTFEGLRLRKEWFDNDGPPASTLLLVPELPVKGARAMIDGVAVRTDAKLPRKAHASGTPGAPMPPHEQIWGYKIYSKAVAGGGFIFTSGRTNNVIGNAGAKADPIRPYQQNRPREATAVILDYLLAMLDDFGAGKQHIVKADIHVSDMAYLPALDRVWYDVFGTEGPARSVMPAAYPTDNTIIEIEFVCVDPSGPFKRDLIDVAGVERSNRLVPHAVSAGDYLFLSEVTPSLAHSETDAATQMMGALQRAGQICEAAGAKLSHTVRQRMAFDDLNWLSTGYEAWCDTVGAIPPTSAFSSVTPMGKTPSFLLDLVVWSKK